MTTDLATATDSVAGSDVAPNSDAGERGQAGSTLPWPVVGAVLTAVGYASGYLAMEAAADELGVSPRDLGLDVRDYLTMAGLTAGSFAAAAAAMVAAAHGGNLLEDRFRSRRRWWHRPRAHALSSLPTGLAALVSLGVMTSLGVDLLLGIVIASGLGLGSLFCLATDPARRWVRPTGLVLLTVAALAASTVVAHETRDWARNLRAAVAAGDAAPEAPVPTRFLLRAHLGLAVAGNDESCVVRLTQDILLGTDAVVVQQLDRFTSQTCVVDPVPLG